MRLINFLPFLLCLLKLYGDSLKNTTELCPNIKTPISAVRKRRHITFPDGSNADITISMAKTFLTHVPSGWYMTSDLDVAYPLPNAEFTLAHSRKKLHHRQKRQLWEMIQKAIELHNIDGRACLLKSICEAKIYLASPGKSLVHDMLRAIFRVPEFEKEFQEEMGEQYNEFLDPNLCDTINDCPLSLLNFMFGLKKSKDTDNM